MVVALTGLGRRRARGRGHDRRARASSSPTPTSSRRSISPISWTSSRPGRPRAGPTTAMRVIDWPSITFVAGRARAATSSLVAGPEPSLRWPTVAAAIVEVARTLRRARRVHARRACPRSCRTAGRSRCSRPRRTARSRRRSAPLRPDYGGPTGLQTVVQRALGDAGVPGAGLVGPGAAVRRRARRRRRRSARCSRRLAEVGPASSSTCARSTSAATRTRRGSKTGSRPGPTCRRSSTSIDERAGGDRPTTSSSEIERFLARSSRRRA